MAGFPIETRKQILNDYKSGKSIKEISDKLISYGGKRCPERMTKSVLIDAIKEFEKTKIEA